jgi:hypothetical protein
MRNVWRGIGFLTLVCVLAGCPFLKKKGGDQDAASEAGLEDSGEAVDATTAAPVPAPTAENEADVKRYDDETKLDQVAATIQWTVANVKTEAGAGELVSVLKKGTEVSKLAEHSTYTLITFGDPATTDKKLMGWVGKSVFTAEVAKVVDAGKVHPKCGTGEGLLLLEGGDERCVTVCTTDAQCPRGYSCTGDGPLSENGGVGKMIRFCNLAGKRVEDAGAAPVDAGKDSGTTADAGATATDAGSVKDAGMDAGKADAGAATKAITAKKNGLGLCPLGYVVSADICRLACTKDGDCGAAGRCQTGKCYAK